MLCLFIGYTGFALRYAIAFYRTFRIRLNQFLYNRCLVSCYVPLLVHQSSSAEVAHERHSRVQHRPLHALKRCCLRVASGNVLSVSRQLSAPQQQQTEYWMQCEERTLGIRQMGAAAPAEVGMPGDT
jgi:hypothetical protein